MQRSTWIQNQIVINFIFPHMGEIGEEGYFLTSVSLNYNLNWGTIKKTEPKILDVKEVVTVCEFENIFIPTPSHAF